jgi:CHAD domain-containing protein
VNSCIRHFRLNEAIFLEDRNAAALHQSRVAIRRLRSAFSIFKPMIGDAGAELRDAFRWLSSELGDARNLDVLLERAGPGQLRDRIVVARETAYDRVCEVLASPRVRLLMLEFAEWAAGDTWAGSFVGKAGCEQSARKFAIKALNRFRRKVKKDGHDLAHADDGVRHELRKDAKKLRYAAEFFATLLEKKGEKRRYKRFVRALQSLQDQLGSMNDLATAPVVLEKLGMTNDVDARELLACDKKKNFLRRAEKAHSELIDIKRFWK